MVGFGMIFDDTYRPLFERRHADPVFSPATGPVSIQLTAAASRTGARASRFLASPHGLQFPFANFSGPDAITNLLAAPVDAVCVATPDDRHFDAARAALSAGKHVLIEKPSVLRLARTRRTHRASPLQNGVLAKVVYHKLADPDHKKLRTHVADGVLQHVNNGYCSLLEPKSISGGQFAEWIAGRNPGTYVAVHYLKLIDFTFGPNWSLDRVTRHRPARPRRPGGRPDLGLGAAAGGLRHPDGREAAFDIHTSWVTPDNFPGYVEQEVQFRFDNGVWNAHQRKRGVELTVENRTPGELKIHSEPSLQRHVPRAVGRTVAARLRHRDHRAVLPTRWRSSSSAARPTERAERLEQMRALDLQRPVRRPQLRRDRAGAGGDPAHAPRPASRAAW